jgi:hypothetical protein
MNPWWQEDKLAAVQTLAYCKRIFSRRQKRSCGYATIVITMEIAPLVYLDHRVLKAPNKPTSA